MTKFCSLLVYSLFIATLICCSLLQIDAFKSMFLSRTCHLKIKQWFILFFYPPTSSSSIMPSFTNISLKKHTNPSTINVISSLDGTIRTSHLDFHIPIKLEKIIGNT